MDVIHFHFYFFFFNDTATTEIYTLSLHDALPISDRLTASVKALDIGPRKVGGDDRAVVLTRAGPAHRAPLTEPDTVAPPRAGRDEPADLAAILRHREREGRAAE